MAEAPPVSYAFTCWSTSRLGLITPFDGDERLTSAMIATSRFRKACAKPGATSVSRARSLKSFSEGASVAARAAASSVNSPRVPVGFVQSEKACASVDLRLTYEFGKCSVGSARRSDVKPAAGKGYVAHKTPAGHSHLPRDLYRRARVRAEVRGDRDQ